MQLLRRQRAQGSDQNTRASSEMIRAVSESLWRFTCGANIAKASCRSGLENVHVVQYFSGLASGSFFAVALHKGAAAFHAQEEKHMHTVSSTGLNQRSQSTSISHGSRLTCNASLLVIHGADLSALPALCLAQSPRAGELTG